MTAIISGNGLGLINGSGNILGGAGAVGSAGLGRGGDSVTINAATGNLVIQRLDEILMGQGPDVGVLRTYNSQGRFDGDNNDNWRIGFYRQIKGITGIVNTADSTVTRVDPDGAELTYTYDNVSGKYLNRDGSGSLDTLSYSASQWTWTDGDSRVTELYDWIGGTGKLLNTCDIDGNTVAYGYTGNLLTSVLSASGEITYLDYTGTNLTQIRVVKSDSITLIRTRYTYDANNRLSTVTVDLSPEDNSIADGKTYVTTYTYDGTSRRIASIAQTDGSLISFTYDTSARVATQMQTSATGVTRTTTFAYTSNGATNQTANLDRVQLSTTDTQHTPQSAVLNSNALTTPAPIATWAGATLLETLSVAANDAQIQADQNGNLFALWRENSNLIVRRYSSASNIWSAALALDNRTNAITSPHLFVESSGNAIATWVQSDGTGNSIYVVRYSVSTNTWSVPALIDNLATIALTPQAAINNSGRAILVWRQATTGTTTPNNLIAAVFNGTTWSAPQLLETNNNDITAAPSVAVDNAGNATILWAQRIGTETNNSIYQARYTAATNSFSAADATQLETAPTAASVPRVAFDQNGNGLAIYVQAGNLYAHSYTASGNIWSIQRLLENRTNTVSTPHLSMSANGNALVTWVQSDGTANSIYARRYIAGVWQNNSANQDAGELLETLTTAALTSRGSINNAGDAAVVWRQPTSGTNNDLYASRYASAGWHSAELLESNANNITQTPGVALTPDGQIQTLWQQSDGTAASIYGNRNTSVVGQLYYTIPSGATWGEIAQAIYGVSPADASSAGIALQAALGDPPLTTGSPLSGFPSALNYTVTTVVAVPPYYLTPAGATWASITQALYGTSNTNAIAALQTALGNPTLATGARLTGLPATLNYTQAIGLTGTITTITDPLGNLTTLRADAKGQLQELILPAINGISQNLAYTYNANGDVITSTDARGNQTVYEYDTNGNQTLVRDSLGNTISRTYGTKNELLTETRYVVPDPDSAGAALPNTPLTTRYAYDNLNHLRYSVSAEGRVTEYRYNAAGQRTSQIDYAANLYNLTGLAANVSILEATLTAWRNSTTNPLNQAATVRVDTTYDFRGQIDTVTRYQSVDTAGNGVTTSAATTQYLYDQAGNLLQTIEAKGVATTATTTDFVTQYFYDGLARLFRTIDSLGTVTLTQYDDTNNRTTTTLTNGLTTTSTYNRAGQLISVAQSHGANALGSTTYTYDGAGRLKRVTDPTGVATYSLYDAANRKVADLQADGSLTEYQYNQNNQLTRTIRYANAVNAANLTLLVDDIDAGTHTVTLATIRPATNLGADQTTWNLYDRAGHLAKIIDALGYVTETQYDGTGRAIANVRYNNAMSSANLAALTLSSLPTDAATLVAADATNDRRTRMFFDNDGKLQGTLDAAGYLTENQYDAAGRLIHTIAYATQTNSTYWASGTLAQLRPVTSANDIHGWLYYDSRNQLIASVDGEGYLTEHTYDLNSNQTQTTRWANQALIAPQSITSATPLSALRPAAHVQDQVTTWAYTDLNQVNTETNAQGTVTHYTYDSVGKLSKTERALGTSEVRTSQARYDRQGRLTGELTAEGSVALAALVAPTQVQIDALWVQYGLTHAYDQAGRRISTTDQNGNKTRFYFNTDGNLTHTINALGEVTETKYNVLNQATDTLVYGTRINLTTLATLNGGLVDTPLTNAISAITNASLDSKTSVTYTQRGQIATNTDALGKLNSTTYNAFGEKVSFTEQIDATNNVVTDYFYDQRGALSELRVDSAGLNLTTQMIRDAFGRVINQVDANRISRQQTYDHLGRIVQVQDSFGFGQFTTYDAFSRVLTKVDQTGNVTSYSYSPDGKEVTVTTTEGVQTISTVNRHGQTISLRDGNGHTTTYTYDVNGNLKTTVVGSGSLNLTTQTHYDNADRIIETVDANGTQTVFTYDAANRVLTKTVDPSGVSLVTSYAYDAKGQRILETAADGRITETQYDLKSQVLRQVIDPSGLNLRTSFAYDKRGKTLEVRQAENTAVESITRHVYDKAGRLLRTQVDPNGLNLVTQFFYDANGNLLRRVDANGGITFYTYDTENRLRYTFDPTAALTESVYDANGRLVQTIRYATLQIGLLPANPINWTGVFNTAGIVRDALQDQVLTHLYDADGRKKYDIDTLGGVTEYKHDANGNVIAKIQYATRVTIPSNLSSATNLQPVNDSMADRVNRFAYDAANRLVFTINALGSVTQNFYDQASNVIKTRVYTNPLNLAGFPDLNTIATAVNGMAQISDRVTRSAYDVANRVVYAVNSEGYVTKNEYDELGRIVRQLQYAQSITISDGDTLAVIASRLPAQPDATTLVTRHVYDKAGRSIFTIDGAGYVKETSYDALGRISATKLFASAVAGVNVLTESALRSMLVANATQDQQNTYSYDKAGRLLQSTDSEGYQELFLYDALGNKLSFTNKNGAVWSYQYDAMGRLLREISPPVNLTSVQNTGNGALSINVGASGLKNVVTAFTYDAFGDLRIRTEAQGLAEERVTRYEYNQLGQQTKIIHPAVVLQGGSQPVNPETWVLYDVFGQAVTNRDVAGNYSYKIYDRLGRVTQEVDAAGYVTAYQYNAFDQVTYLTRHASRTTLGNNGFVILNTGQVNVALGSVNFSDRTIVNKYDKLGRVTEIVEPTVFVHDTDAQVGYQDFYAGKTTRNLYDAFGRLIRRSILKNLNTNQWSETIYYYDQRGLKKAEIDALGYVTQYTHDAAGNIISQAEFARTSSSWTVQSYAAPLIDNQDRLTQFQYDRRNKKISETRVNAEFSPAGTASSIRQNLTTYFAYDAVGNQTAVTDHAGATTYTYYDGLGRVSALAAPIRTVLGQAGMIQLAPLTEFSRDAYGNVVAKIDRAHGASLADTNNYVRGSDSAEDRYSFSRFNAHGKTVQTTDALGNSAYATYDALGRLVQKWQTVTDNNGQIATQMQVFAYDALGQQISQIETSNPALLDSGLIHQVIPNTFDENNIASAGLVNLQWAGLVDPRLGDVRVEIDYHYPLSVVLDENGNVVRDENGNPIYAPGGAGETRSHSQIFTAAQAVAGVTIAIQAVDALYNIRLYQRDAQGNWAEKYNRPASASVGSQLLYVGQAGTISTEQDYNAFGEMVRKGTNGGWQEYFDYDNAGRLWRTNTGDGVDKIALHNLAGQTTSDIRSNYANLRSMSDAQQANGLANTRRIDTVYDLLGRTISQTAPERNTAGLGGTQERSVTVNFSSTITSSVTVTLDESGNPVYDESGNLVATGQNIVNLNWTELASLGNGDVRVEIDYTTQSTTARYLDENGQTVINTVPGVVRSYSAVLIEADYGAQIVIPESGGTTVGVGSINLVKLYKQDVNGSWQLIMRAAGNGNIGNRISIPVPTDLVGPIQMQYRPVGGGNWLLANVINFGDSYLLDTQGLQNGNYEYQVVYCSSQDSAPIVQSTGQFSVTTPTLIAIQSTFGFTTTTSLGLLTWSSPGASVTQQFNYRLIGAFAWSSLVVTPRGSGQDAVDFAGLPIGTYEFELLSTYAGQALPYAHATGQVTIGAGTPARWVPPQGLPVISSQIAVTTRTVGGTPQIIGYDESGNPIYAVDESGNPIITGGTLTTALSWFPAPAGNTVAFEYRPMGRNSWSALTVVTQITGYDESNNPVGSQFVDVGNLSAGDYEFRLLFTAAGSQTPTAHRTGNLTIHSPSAGHYETVTVPVQVTVTVTPDDPTRYITGALYGPPVITGYDENGVPILGQGYSWQNGVGSQIIATPYTTYVTQRVPVTITPSNPENYIIGATRPTYSAPVVTGYDENGEPILAQGYSWSGNIVVATPYTVYQNQQQTITVTPANPANYITGYTRTVYGAPVVTGYDENGEPILAQGYSWNGNVVVATPYTVYQNQQQTITVTPANPANYITGATRATYGSPVFTGYDENGQPILGQGYQWSGNVVIAVPYTVYQNQQQPVTVTPPNPDNYISGYTRATYSSPVFVGYDENGQPILGQGYQWSGSVVVAVPYQKTETQYQWQQIAVQVPQQGNPIILGYDENGAPIYARDENGNILYETIWVTQYQWQWVPVQVQVTVTPTDPNHYRLTPSVPIYTYPVVTGYDGNGNPILAQGYQWSGNRVVAVPYTVYQTVQVPVTITPADPNLYLITPSRPTYGYPVVVGTDENGTPILGQGYQWSGNVVIAVPYTTTQTIQVPVRVTPADPALSVITPSRPTYGYPVVVGTDENGTPILGQGYQWSGNVVIAVPYTSTQTIQVPVTVTPADPNQYITTQSRPIYSPPVFIGTDENGTPILGQGYQWFGNVVIAVPYTVYQDRQVPVTVTPENPNNYITGYRYSSPVVIGTDENGQPILGQGYQWRDGIFNGTVIAVPYTTTRTDYQTQQVWVPGTTPSPTLIDTTPPYVPGYTIPAVPNTYSLEVNTPTNSSAISIPATTQGQNMSLSVMAGRDQTARPTVLQTLDRWGNILSVSDPRNAEWLTLNTFNIWNQVVRQQRVDGWGNYGSESPVIYSYYDLMGRVTATQDANGNVNAQIYDLPGNLVEERAADGGVIRHYYNSFGDRTRSVDALGRTTDYLYDKMGRITTIIRPEAAVFNMNDGFGLTGGTVQRVSEQIAYDELGRKIRVTNGAGETQRYEYDLRGNLTKATLPIGQSMQYAYDSQNRKMAEVDGNGFSATWTYDYFGKLLAHRDIGGAEYTYTYSLQNELLTQTNTRGQSLQFDYDQSGQLLTSRDHALNQTTTYRYDLAGNRIREQVWQNGQNYQNNLIAYDALGRIAQVSGVGARIQFNYDRAGNRTRQWGTYHGAVPANTTNLPGGTARLVEIAQKISGSSNGLNPAVKNFDYHYFYDNMNRLRVADAVDAAGTIIDGQGHRFSYDQAGNRISDTYIGSAITETTNYHYDENGNVIGSWVSYSSPGKAEITENYQYDGLNRLTETRRAGMLIDTRYYDAASRLLQTGTGVFSKQFAEMAGIAAETKLTTYNANGQIKGVRVLKDDGGWKYHLYYTKYDSAGNVLEYQMHNHEGQSFVNTYTSNYLRFEGYKASAIHGSSTYFQSGSSINSYDVNGNLIAVSDSTRSESNRNFVNDAQGRILFKNHQGHIERQMIANNNVIGRYGIGVDEKNPTTADGQPNYVSIGYFNQSYTPINTGSSGGAVQYVVQTGDTLETIAANVYGNSKLWYIIADANGLNTNADLTVGMSLIIPNRVDSGYNDFKTFKPYDSSILVGDTTPNLPTPNVDKCGQIILTIITIVIALIVTIASYGVLTGQSFAAAAAAMSSGTASFGALAVSTAIGSAVSQGVAIAMGIQEKFSWEQVGLAALGSLVGSLLPAPSSFASGYAGIALRAATASAITQGIGVATGLQKKFSWAGVAAAGVSAVVGAAVSDAIGTAQFGDTWDLAKQAGSVNGDQAAINASAVVRDATWSQIARDVGSGLVSGAVRQLITSGRVEWRSVAADAFGNALGNAITNAAGSAEIKSQQEQQLKLQLASFDTHQPTIARSLDELTDAQKKALAMGYGPLTTEAAERRINASVVEKQDYSMQTGQSGQAQPTNTTSTEDYDNYDFMGTPRQVGIAGKEAARGAWGIAKSLAGSGASNAEINRIKNQLLELNPELAGPIRTGQQYYLPEANTPENFALAKSVDDKYQKELAARIATRQQQIAQTVLAAGLMVEPSADKSLFSHTPETLSQYVAKDDDLPEETKSLSPPRLTIGQRAKAHGLGVLDAGAGVVESAGYSFGVGRTPEERAAWAIKTSEDTIQGMKKFIDDPLGTVKKWWDNSTGEDPEAIRQATAQGTGVVMAVAGAKVKVTGRLNISRGVNKIETFAANEIRFSQDSVSFNKVDRVTGQSYTYDDLVTSMRSNGWKGDPVDVVRMPDSRLTSIDNTRIIAAREAGIDVQANVRSFELLLTKDEIGRFTKGSQVPVTWGDAITIRINSQRGGFGVKYPYGANSLPLITGRSK